MERIKKYEPLWGKWTVKRIIGEGSFGVVYEVESEKFGNRSSCAVKLVSFKNTEMLQGIVDGETLSSEELEKLKLEEARKNVREAVLMEKLQGRDHIVTIHDYDIFPGETTTDVIIRMELLTNLNDYMKQYATLSESDLKRTVIKLGIDIGWALEECEDEKIVHRDIKPDNIFINKNGTFKLGDFGLSRKMNKSASFSLRKSAGTPFYMAPESLGWANKTDYQSDIYSLGMVMYQLLNDGRIPFVKSMKNFSEIDDAIERRADGEELQPPKHDEGELWNVIQKACRFKKEERYHKASDMRRDLERLQNKHGEKEERQKNKETDSDEQRAKNLLDIAEEEKQIKKESVKQKKEEPIVEKNEESGNSIPKEKEKKNKKLIFSIIGMIALLGIAGIFLNVFNNYRVEKKQYKVGDTISFGRYPQDEDGGVKPIEWTVMKTEENKVLLLSKYVLDAQPYNKEFEEVTWETSDIRRWLNSGFYTTAFNDIEQSKVADTLVGTENNPMYGTDGGNDTEDKVFLLSIEEAGSLFINDKERRALATKYAKKAGVWITDEGNAMWWLRSPGRDSYDAAEVDNYGWIDRSGRGVYSNYAGVRPALWLNL